MSRLVENREYECIYCGIEYDKDGYLDLDGICECGGYLTGYNANTYENYKYYGFNNIDSLLEDKRSGRYRY